MNAEYSELFKNKKILVIGGTGSIGSKIIEELILYLPKEIRIFSRDEYKQHQLRYKYADNQTIEYILGDIRDRDSLEVASKNIDVIFHCAALKHVPVSEEMPEEFIKTNILGSLNIKKTAIINSVPVVISISTDKAVNPTNVMGLTKAIQEKIFASHVIRHNNNETKFINVRFGNVIGTHGSLFPILYHQIKNELPITITVGEMTRFFMSKSDAIELIFWSALHGKDGDTIIKKMKSVRIDELITDFIQKMGKDDSYPIKKIGVRIGEKLHESLITEDELYRTQEHDGFFVISPYTKNQIEVNVIKNDNTKDVSELDQLSSNEPSNYLTKEELSKLIEDYIEEKSSDTSYI